MGSWDAVRPLFGIVVVSPFFTLLCQKTATLQGSKNSGSDGVHQNRHLFIPGNRRAMKLGVGLLDLNHPIEKQHVKVDIEIEGGPKPLNERHRSRLEIPRIALTRSPPSIPPGDRSMNDVQAKSEKLRSTGQEEAQRERKTQNPLPNRYMRKHFIHQQRRRLRHSSAPARWTEPTFLAGKRHGPLRKARLAPHSQESMP